MWKKTMKTVAAIDVHYDVQIVTFKVLLCQLVDL